LKRSLADADAGGPLISSITRTQYSFLVDDPQEAARILRPAISAAKDQLLGFHLVPPLLCAARIVMQTGRQRLAARLVGAFEHDAHDLTGVPAHTWVAMVDAAHR